MATHITIGDLAPRAQYSADGTQITFTYLFPIFQEADLQVYCDATLQTSGYSVAGAGSSGGGSVTFTTAPSVGTNVILVRRLPVERLTDFQESGEFRSQVLNDELDYLTATMQQVEDDQSRSLQYSLTETATIDPTLPSPDANKALVWNGTGDGFANGPATDQIASAQTAAITAVASAQIASDGAATAENWAQIAAAAAAAPMYSSNQSRSANFTVAATDNGTQYLIDTTAGSVTVTLPEGATAIDGFRIALAKTSADNNAVIVNSVGTDTLNGGTSWQFSVPHGQSVITLDTTPAPDTWFAAGVGLVAPVGVADINDNAKPYDIAFLAGFGTTMLSENVAVQSYGELVVSRTLKVLDEVGYIDVAAAGQAVVVDVLKNGASIYTTPPQFSPASNAMSPGTLSTTQLVAGDRLSFAVTQVGTTTAGQGVRFTLKTALN